MEPAGRIDAHLWEAPETVAVFKALSARGAVVRLVGGCVRDAIMGRAIKDMDIATDAKPDTVIELLQAAGLKSVPTGIDYGTITAISGSIPFEVTTLRRDVETFGRHARVAFTDDWAQDAARRDFTMNALYCDLDGTLYDPMEGLADARAGRVRFVGDPGRRIEEDRLRILRFFRFHAWFGKGDPDNAGLAACTAGADQLSALSAERVRAEVLRLLEATDPAPVFNVMVDHGILADLLPEATRTDCLANMVAIETELDRTDPVRRLGAVLEIKPDSAGMPAVSERLRLSNIERDRLVALLKCEAAPNPSLPDQETRRLQYELGSTLFVDAALLGWAESGDRADAADWASYIDAAEQREEPVFPLRGADVVALGVAAGPEIGVLLGQVERWWVEGDFDADRSACLDKLQRVTAI